MSMQKWEFVEGDEIKIDEGHTVKRIRALVTIEALDVTPGTLGGYVEFAENLPESTGEAWVGDDACVFGDARVLDDAWVHGNSRVFDRATVRGRAQVSGESWIHGNAQVSERAWVSGDAQVRGDAVISGETHVSGEAEIDGDARVSSDGMLFWATKVGSENGTLTVFNGANGLSVTHDCLLGSVSEFLIRSRVEHDASTHHEFKLLVEVAQSRISRALAGFTPRPTDDRPRTPSLVAANDCEAALSAQHSQGAPGIAA